MKKALFLFCSLILCLSSFEVMSQTPEITDPEIKLEGDVLSIFYDILNSNNLDKYEISVDIKDESGNTVYARSLSGDIGEDITGGTSKEIQWDLAADNIRMNTMLYFQVRGVIVQSNPPEQITNAIQEEIKETNTEYDAGASPPSSTANISKTSGMTRGSVVAQSLLLPGLGLTKLRDGKPHWLKGVAGYSCLAGGVSFYFISAATRDQYLASRVPDDRTRLYNTSVMQQTISNALLIGAASVWVVDLIWNVAGSAELKKAVKLYSSNRIHIYPAMDDLSYSPLLTLRCEF